MRLGDGRIPWRHVRRYLKVAKHGIVRGEDMLPLREEKLKSDDETQSFSERRTKELISPSDTSNTKHWSWTGELVPYLPFLHALDLVSGHYLVIVRSRPW